MQVGEMITYDRTITHYSLSCLDPSPSYDENKNKNTRRETQGAKLHLGDPNCPNFYLRVD